MLTQISLWMVPVLNAQGLSELLEQNPTFCKEDMIYLQRLILARTSFTDIAT